MSGQELAGRGAALSSNPVSFGWWIVPSKLRFTKRGVTFEHYDEPGLKTDEKGIATFEGDANVAYFKGPDGHTLSIAQAPRS